jgi:hypothetical protein
MSQPQLQFKIDDAVITVEEVILEMPDFDDLIIPEGHWGTVMDSSWCDDTNQEILLVIFGDTEMFCFAYQVVMQDPQ